MYTVDTVLESLQRYEIDEADIAQWEKALGLNIPKNEYGRKQYSPHHVNLFKNIKKHLTLGRTLDEIRSLIKLPPIEDSHPRQQAASTGNAPAANCAANFLSSSVILSSKEPPVASRCGHGPGVAHTSVSAYRNVQRGRRSRARA
mgnify:CR=1 FL=1